MSATSQPAKQAKPGHSRFWPVVDQGGTVPTQKVLSRRNILASFGSTKNVSQKGQTDHAHGPIKHVMKCTNSPHKQVA